MKLRILVFEPEPSLRELLQAYLVGLGLDVQSFEAPSSCPLFRNLLDKNCYCPHDVPCGDVVMMDMRMPNINAFDFLKLQRRRGCKAIDSNKAVMSTSVTKEVEDAMANFGCHHIVKPFRLSAVKEWVNECIERVKGRGDL